MSTRFQPTLPLRGATDPAVVARDDAVSVSTHAPCAGLLHRRVVSTHAPLAGSDIQIAHLEAGGSRFQPTLPLRGATPRDEAQVWACLFQPTLPLRGATAMVVLVMAPQAWFQPTLPLRGATGSPGRFFGIETCFNPRSPCGERRGVPFDEAPERPVSTHAPLAGSDEDIVRRRLQRPRFNPRSPCGERPEADQPAETSQQVSTHAPLAGSDRVM